MHAGSIGLAFVLLAVLTDVAVSAVAQSPSFVAWHGVVEIAQGRGEKGPWRQNESRYDYVDDATVAINERGEIIVAWADQGDKAVLVRRYSAEAAGRARRRFA